MPRPISISVTAKGYRLPVTARVHVPAPNINEAALVLESRRGPEAVPDLRLALRQGGIEVLPLDEELAWGAHAAWQRFGKGRHAAGLNFGDCFAYALAKSMGVPLLFKGDDFTHTDVAVAG